MTTTGRPDWKALAAQAQPTRKTVRLCLRGDLVAQQDEARQAGDRNRADELQGPIDEASFDFVLQGLPRNRYKALEQQHPDPDDVLKFNPETFLDELTFECLVQPEMDRGEFNDLMSVLTVGQSEALREAAFTACNDADALPLPRRG